jgi:hypothetical protein
MAPRPQHAEQHNAAETVVDRCPECGCTLLQPLDWESAGSTLWAVTLECPNCWHLVCRVFDDDEIEEFERRMDLGVELIVRVLDILSEANMTDDVARAIAALRAGAIEPMDF